MKRITEKKKDVKKLFLEMQGQEWFDRELKDVVTEGKHVLDACMMEIGKMMAETLMQIEREQIAGLDYRPAREGLQKWGFQNGSIYLGDQKEVDPIV